MKSSCIFVFLLTFHMLVQAQSAIPIGQWRDHVPFRFVKSVFLQGQNTIAATQYGLFRYSTVAKEFERLTKSNGLSEVEIKLAEKDPASDAILIAYQNQNIDFIDGDNIKNIPDVLNSKVQGDKTINNFKWVGKDVYISTNLGILVLNPLRAEIKATYRIGSLGSDLAINQVAVVGNTIYAATSNGLRKTVFDSIQMRNYQSWTSEKVTFDQESITNVINWNNQLIIQKYDSVFLNDNLTWRLLYAAQQRISCLTVRNNRLYIGLQSSGSSTLLVFNNSREQPQVLQIPSLTVPKGIDENNGELWIADEQRGVIKYSNGKEEIILPNSPYAISTGKSFIYDNNIWATGGRVENGIGKKLPGAFFQWNGSSWTNYTGRLQPFLDSMSDIHTITVQPETGLINGGSFGGGQFELDKNGGVKIFKQNSFLSPTPGFTSSYQVGGLAYDANQTLWISNPSSTQSIIAKTKQGDLRKFTIPQDPINNSVGTILIDKENRKWILGGPNNGMVCFDDGGTLDRTSDDRWRFFRQGKGSGNLPSSYVLCLREDRNGLIWVGTSRGVAIIPCLDDVFNSSRCEAVLPIVQQNNVAGVLLSEEEIHDIEVDGADRKWIATTNGVWLLSADGQQTVYRFTSSNSPLLCNKVYEITLDGKTGEVYFHTECGISVFRSTATEPEGIQVKATVFPNPVPSGFNGSIAIRNLPENAWVRIAELDGKLVYQTRSLGGQAIWNGRNYKGEKINSGVYLVYIADENNQQQLAAKIFFIQ